MKLWKRHGTKVLGYITSTIPAVLLIEGLIPPTQVKYYLLALVLLGGATVKRGHTNTNSQQEPTP
jgi:hypothetical protein